MKKCNTYFEVNIEQLINAGIENQIENLKAVYLFKYNFINSIDFSSEQTVFDGILSLIEQSYHEKSKSFLGLFFDTTIALSSKPLPDKKNELLEKLISNDVSNNYKNIKSLLGIISENQQPLYIGKANKLADRINQHLNGNSSDLKDRLKIYNIDIESCILNYHYVDDNLNDDTNLLFEDIITRILKPGFVRRIG